MSENLQKVWQSLQFRIYQCVPSGTVLSIKLGERNYDSRRSLIVPLLNGYDLMHCIENDPPVRSVLNDQRVFMDNPLYKAWWKTDLQVLEYFISGISESVKPNLKKRNPQRKSEKL